MPDLTPEQVGTALRRLGRYRVGRAHEVAARRNDGIGGHHFLALGMREIGLSRSHWNVEGGARLVNGEWVAEDNPAMMDVGPFQISRKYHATALRNMPGVRVSTWEPVVPGKTANDGGYAPRWWESMEFVDREFAINRQFGITSGVYHADLVHFVLAAHNAGQGGALRGYREGNVDKYTTYGNYGATALRYAKTIRAWVAEHPAWRTSR